MHARYKVWAVVTLSIGVASMAWAADEPAQPATAPAAQPAAQPAPSAPAASSTSTEPAAKVPAKDTATEAGSANSAADAQEKHLLASGYKKKTRNGETVYCKKEMPLGSRFEKERCGSVQEMEMQAQQARDLINSNRVTGGGSK